MAAANMNEWLNSLTAEEAWAVYSEMRTAVGHSTLVQISGGMSPENLCCLGANSPRTGNWYMEWVRCEIINLSVPGTGHPRWQPTIVNKVGGTPTNSTSLGRLIKSHLAKAKWDNLKGLSSSNGQVKFPSHHLAFRASYPGVSIPANMGHGASMSHLCDSPGCIRGEHLELTSHHVANLERQRCHGVTLIVAADLIVHEVPCTHGRGGNPSELIATSCRKLRMVWLPDASVNALIETYQQILQAISTPHPSQTY
jgi:Zinc-binding loop region of homing endonuclease